MSGNGPGGVVWVAWESQPRNRSMARELGATFREFPYSGPAVLRYLQSLWATTRFLLRARPSVVCAPNPSLVLTYWLLLLRPLLSYRLVSDAHYGGVVSYDGSRARQRLLNFANRRADIVIVTNPGHERFIRDLGGTPLICPDPLPQLPSREPASAGTEKRVLFICSFDPDEPYDAVLTAAPLLAARGFRLLVSGNYRKGGLNPATVTDATLLGYVEQSAYYQHVHRADVLLDLTTFQDCLVCGAYEGMAAGKPCVLSGTEALRQYFTHGVVFTSHEPAEIVHAVIEAYDQRERLQREIAPWRERHARHIARQIAAIRAALNVDSPEPRPRQGKVEQWPSV